MRGLGGHGAVHARNPANDAFVPPSVIPHENTKGTKGKSLGMGLGGSRKPTGLGLVAGLAFRLVPFG